MSSAWFSFPGLLLAGTGQTHFICLVQLPWTPASWHWADSLYLPGSASLDPC